jgi:hypothetical protein
MAQFRRVDRPKSIALFGQIMRLPRITVRFPYVAEILSSHRGSLGPDLPGYQNHVYRVLNYFAALSGTDDVPKAVLIASAFHDLGIWTDRTFDYIAPSIRHAQAYLKANDLAHLEPEVHALIEHHHKLRPFAGAFSSSVETYRRADLIDLSLGWIRFGLPASFIASVRAVLPNAGFHRRLIGLAGRQFIHSPLRPLPMVRW